MNAKRKNKIKKALSFGEFHKKNEEDEAYRFSKVKTRYEKAQEELTALPYSQRMKPLDNFLFGFRSVYHFASVILGLATCALASLIFSGISAESNQEFPLWLLLIITLLIGGLMVGILVVVELAKIALAKNIFKAKAKRQSIGNFSIIGLTFLVFVSIALSGIGGALISYKMGDKTQQLSKNLKTGRAKITRQHGKRLVQLNGLIAGLEAMSVDKKVRRWGLTKEEQANLQVAKAEKKQIIATKTKELTSLGSKHNQSLQANQVQTSTTMYIALGLIALLELITVYAYFFHYEYLGRTAMEGVELEVLPNPESDKEETASEPDLNEIISLLSKALNGVNPPPASDAALINTLNVPPQKKQEVSGFIRYDDKTVRGVNGDVNPHPDNVVQDFIQNLTKHNKGINTPNIDFESASFLEAYKEVIPFVLDGSYKNREICSRQYNIRNLTTRRIEKKGLSVSTLRTLRQCLKSAGVLKE